MGSKKKTTWGMIKKKKEDGDGVGDEESTGSVLDGSEDKGAEEAAKKSGVGLESERSIEKETLMSDTEASVSSVSGTSKKKTTKKMIKKKKEDGNGDGDEESTGSVLVASEDKGAEEAAKESGVGLESERSIEKETLMSDTEASVSSVSGTSKKKTTKKMIKKKKEDGDGNGIG